MCSSRWCGTQVIWSRRANSWRSLAGVLRRGRDPHRSHLGSPQGAWRPPAAADVHRDGGAVGISVHRAGHPRHGRRGATPIAIARPVKLYEFVGRGRSHLLSGSYFELPNAVDAFRAAIEIDSTYAPAHAGLARARCAQAALRAVPHQDAFPEAKASALRALAMDSDFRRCPGRPRHRSVSQRVGLGGCGAQPVPRARHQSRSHRSAAAVGSLQEALGHLDDGLRFKQQALARDPRSALVMIQIAMSGTGISGSTTTRSSGRSGLSR